MFNLCNDLPKIIFIKLFIRKVNMLFGKKRYAIKIAWKDFIIDRYFWKNLSRSFKK